MKKLACFALFCAAVSVSAQTLTVPNASFPIDVLVESPAVTQTDLQTICLFQAGPNTKLQGSLAEIDEKLGGLLSRIRTASLFRGELGETVLIVPKPGTIPARRLLLIGLGDLQSFTPDREQVVGFVLFEEAERLGVRHPYFAPTVLDGGKAGMDTGDVAQQFLGGFLRAKAVQDVVGHADLQGLTFLAGPTHAARTRDGLSLAFKAR